MRKIGLTSKLNTTHIEVPVDFIDTFMPQASPEALKVYLYLLRAAADPAIILSVSDMADLFDVTPNKITRALFYWEQEGLLALEYADDEISSLTLLPCESREARVSRAPESPARQEAPAPAPRRHETPFIRQDAPVDFNDLERDENFAELPKLLQFYTKKPVTAVQYEALGLCYLLFDRNLSLTEFLIEFCVEEGHPSMHYMKSVAKNWHEQNLTTVEQAKAYSQERRKRVYTVRKALGITNRSLVQTELDYIENWMRDFDLDLITLACNKAAMKNKVYFSYVDGILSKWKEAGIHTKEEAEAWDEQFSKQYAADAAKKKASDSAPEGPKANFTQRDSSYYQVVRNFYE